MSDVDEAALVTLVAEHRRAGRRVVFTNGCFDILHRGHVECLRAARALGDLLVVAINSDDSVRRLKGPGRPVNPAADRAAVLAALRAVDHVVVFADDTPVRLVGMVRPEVYVKGGDYPLSALPEAPVVHSYGGEVHILPYLAGRSTTQILERAVDQP
jgi:rfaE bifunctional protein nucleotidyltransferase chain/domain